MVHLPIVGAIQKILTAADESSSSPVVAEAEAMTAAQRQLQTTEAAPCTLSPIPEETSEEEKPEAKQEMLRKRKNVCTLDVKTAASSTLSRGKILRQFRRPQLAVNCSFNNPFNNLSGKRKLFE
ncbi:uncharacterized protein LOC121984495 isoform X1 [Zingiber officinale]|uniref:uncharacterized protein LOC121984495 isoform X1 n=1 Tax=Zingiber officinale TaxID=94328 RepID=UPI001C4B1386|nr:uncharacterized protein LOC121984495 isoform X1 [Zingiber officinale]XP_042393367.1 uncharacterized protein LOC121984495 isoform X1 [Zingiber officinale]